LVWGAKISAAPVSGALLVGADLSLANFSRANLTAANLARAELSGTVFAGAVLDAADLSGAKAPAAVFHGARLAMAKLNDTDLRDALGIEFDENEVRGTRFTGRPRSRTGLLWLTRLGGRIWRRPQMRRGVIADQTDDPWSLLRRQYTGARFALTLLAIGAFLLPYVASAAGLIMLGASEERILRAVQADVAATQPGGQELAARVEAVFRQHPPQDAWRVFLGLDQGHWGPLVLLVLLAVFNATRYYLLTNVAPLREAEERSQITPARSEYINLYRLHLFTEVLQWIAIGVSVRNLWRWAHVDVVRLW
jgi:uncharacterized protein YjbI with pentapeptide repeats